MSQAGELQATGPKETENEAIKRRYVVNSDKKLKELYCEIMIWTEPASGGNNQERRYHVVIALLT